MPPELLKPTRRTTLTELCETLAPAWHARFASAADANAPTFHLQMTVNGDTQSLTLTAKGVVHHTGALEAPHLSITCDNDGWRTAMEHVTPLLMAELEKRHGEVHAAISAAQPQAHGALEGFMKNPGTIVCTFVDDAGDEADYTFRIGDGSGPTARVRVDDSKLHTLMQKHATPSQILGSVEVRGDVGYLTRLAQAVGAL